MEIKKLVIASHNQGKVGEIREMLMPYGVEVVSAGELGLPDVEETATTFEGNARLKACAFGTALPGGRFRFVCRCAGRAAGSFYRTLCAEPRF